MFVTDLIAHQNSICYHMLCTTRPLLFPLEKAVVGLTLGQNHLRIYT